MTRFQEYETVWYEFISSEAFWFRRLGIGWLSKYVYEYYDLMDLRSMNQ
jgi:hypothetical protein